MIEYDKNFFEWYKDFEEKKNIQSILNFFQLFLLFDVQYEVYSSYFYVQSNFDYFKILVYYYFIFMVVILSVYVMFVIFELNKVYVGFLYVECF